MTEDRGLRLVIRGGDASDLGANVGRGVVEAFSRPAFRAGVGASAVMAAVCMRAGMRPLPAFLCCMLAHTSVERLWEMAEDIHQTSLAQREYLRKLADAPSPL